MKCFLPKKQMVFGKHLTLRMPSGNTYTGRLRLGKRPMAAGIARVSPCFIAISREKLAKWPGGTYIFNNLIFRFQYTRSLIFLKHISDIDITRLKDVSNSFYHVFTMFFFTIFPPVSTRRLRRCADTHYGTPRPSCVVNDQCVAEWRPTGCDLMHPCVPWVKNGWLDG